MMDFDEWLKRTHELQINVFKNDPASMEGKERADFAMWNVLAALDELHEFLSEVGWKPWVENRGWVNRDAAIGELVDVMHFIANLLVLLNVDGDELAQRYVDKNKKNAIRQSVGDDGVSRVCGKCKRSIDDVGVSTLSPQRLPYVYTVCNGCGHVISSRMGDE